MGALTLRREKAVAAQTITIESSPENGGHAADTEDASNVASQVGIAAGTIIFSNEDRAVE